MNKSNNYPCNESGVKTQRTSSAPTDEVQGSAKANIVSQDNLIYVKKTSGFFSESSRSGGVQ